VLKELEKMEKKSRRRSKKKMRRKKRREKKKKMWKFRVLLVNNRKLMRTMIITKGIRMNL